MSHLAVEVRRAESGDTPDLLRLIVRFNPTSSTCEKVGFVINAVLKIYRSSPIFGGVL